MLHSWVPSWTTPISTETEASHTLTHMEQAVGDNNDQVNEISDMKGTISMLMDQVLAWNMNQDDMLAFQLEQIEKLKDIEYTLARSNDKITNWILKMHETHHQATHDELTNLPNRYFLNEVVLRHLLTSETEVFAQMSVLFLDVDFFKKYNDRYGHVAWDMVLKKLAAIGLKIAKTLNWVIFARYGGEEFVALWGNEETLKKFWERLNEELARDRTLPAPVTVSWGISSVAWIHRNILETCSHIFMDESVNISYINNAISEADNQEIDSQVMRLWDRRKKQPHTNAKVLYDRRTNDERRDLEKQKQESQDIRKLVQKSFMKLVFERPDKIMYFAKQNGKNQIKTASDIPQISQHKINNSSIQLETELSLVIQNWTNGYWREGGISLEWEKISTTH